MGAQGGVWAVGFWMPTYLRTVRHLSATGTGLYSAVLALGSLIGFVCGAYLADAIGRKATFMISAVASIVMVLVYVYVPVGDTALFLFLGIPLNTAIRMKFAPMGPFMTELYPTSIRGTGQGFCYNAGRAIGSVFMTAIGFAVGGHAAGHGDRAVLDGGPWFDDRHAADAAGNTRPRHRKPRSRSAAGLALPLPTGRRAQLASGPLPCTGT